MYKRIMLLNANGDVVHSVQDKNCFECSIEAIKKHNPTATILQLDVYTDAWYNVASIDL